jgi:ADP-heptose:LPS heptosyltransferase
VTHVLVARQDNAGDVLLAGPAVRAVAAHASRVTLICGPAGREAAALLPGVDELVVHPAEWIAADPDPVVRDAVTARVDALAALRADVAMVLTSFHQSPLPLALLLRMAGVPRVGAISVDYPGSLLDVRHAVSDDVHEVERGLSLAAAMGFGLAPRDDDRLRLRGVGDVPRDPEHVVVHPGASVPARAWAAERHAELVRALAREGRRVTVTGGPGERALTRLVSDGGASAEDLGGETTLAELARLIAGAGCVVTGNTGPAHLAAAVGTPVVSLYAPTVPAVRWRPWRVPHELLHVDVPCAGCRARVCPVPGHPCLGGVDVEDVLGAVARLAGAPDPREVAA